MNQNLLRYIPAAALSLTAASLSAQTINWGGLTGASIPPLVWSDPLSWKESVAPTATSDLFFGGPSTGGSRVTNNDFAIGTVFNSITVTANAYQLNGNAFSTANNTLTFTGGNNTTSLNAGWILTADSILHQNQSAGRVDFNGDISGAFGLTKTGTSTVRLQTAAKTFTGATVVSAGFLDYNLANGTAASSGLTIASGATVLVRAGQIFKSFDGAGTYQAGNSGTKTATIGASGADSTFSGLIQNGSGIIAFTKEGAGTQIFSGTNTYTGATTVNAGKVLINGNQALATGAVNVAAAGTLGGTGTIGGNTTVTGSLAPGASPGVLTFGQNLTLNAASTTTFEIGGLTIGTDYDGVVLSNVASVLTTNGSLLFNFTAAANAGVYDLFNFAGTQTGTLAGISLGGLYSGSLLDADLDGVWTGSVGSFGASFALSTGDLTLAIPEPSTYAFIAGVLALGGVVWRRRARR